MFVIFKIIDIILNYLSFLFLFLGISFQIMKYKQKKKKDLTTLGWGTLLGQNAFFYGLTDSPTLIFLFWELLLV